MLSKRHILHYIPHKKTPYIIYTRERQETDRIYLSREVYEDRKESYTERIQAMIAYATAQENCRSRMLLRYFGEKNGHNCGHCDVCLQKHPSGLKQGEFSQLREEIERHLETAPCLLTEIPQIVNADKEKLEKVISFLLAEEIIQLKNGVLST